MLNAIACLGVGLVVVAIGFVNLGAGILAMVLGMAICKEFFSP